jgi:methionyl-tRNA formyltransferase
MNNDIKAIILCNNPVAIPGIKEFLFFGKLAAIGIPVNNKEMQHILANLLAETGVPLLLINKKNYRQQINEAIDLYTPSVVLMMTFPFIIPHEILGKPKQGFINFHYGLLPGCSGPQPILWHLLNNDAHAGITVHKVDEGIDTGDIIMQEKIKIEQNDTYGILQSKLAFLGAKLAAGLMKILSYGSIIPAVKQDKTRAAYFNMPLAKDLMVKWDTMTAAEIVRLVNACNPWNKGAGTVINGWGIGLTEVEIVGDCEKGDMVPGKILSCNATEGLIAVTADNKKLKINIVYTNEGFFSGNRLADFEVKAGNIFG